LRNSPVTNSPPSPAPFSTSPPCSTKDMRDREKSRILQAAGWRCVPVTYLQLEHASAEVPRDLRRLLRGATLAA
jgi:hypothetical protein